MKKITILIVLNLVYLSVSNAQVSLLGFNYQAQIRNNGGIIIPDSSVQLRFTLFPSQFSNIPAWEETQSITTDHYGIASAVIGKGKRTGGTSTSFEKVDFTSGNFWMRVEINSSGNYIKLGNDEPLQSVPYAKVAGNLNLFPAGFIIAFAGDTTKIPSGWLLCDGRAVSRSQFAELYNMIRDNWGRGNNISTFNLPDLRGQFLRGVTGISANDPDAASRTSMNQGGNTGNNVGSYQPDDIKSHNHQQTTTASIALPGNLSSVADFHRGGAIADPIYTNPTGGNESRPKNAYVNFLIKY